MSAFPAGVERGQGGARRPLHSLQQLPGCASYLRHLSIPKAPLCFAPLPRGARGDPGRGAHNAEGRRAVAAPPNPFGAPFAAPVHPFLEVSLSLPPISLLPEFGGTGLAVRLGKESVGLSEPGSASLLVPLVYATFHGLGTRFRSGPKRIPNCKMTPIPI